MKSAKIIVVTPVYSTPENERLPMLLQNIYSVQKQTMQDFVHVIVNDGSSDETKSVLDRIAQKRSNVLVYHTPNRGASAAINFGITVSADSTRAQYLTVIHSDDLLTPRSLESRIGIASKTGSKMVYSDMVITDEMKRHPPIFNNAKKFTNSREMYNCLLDQQGINYPTLLWDRNFFVNDVGGYDPRIASAEDWDIALRSSVELDKRNEKFDKSDEVSVICRMHKNNLREENIRKGIKWECYKMIFAKHTSGLPYYARLARAGFRLLKESLPESTKSKLRPIKRAVFGKYKEEEMKKFLFDVSPLDCAKELSN